MAMPGPFEWLILIGIGFVVGGALWQRRVRRRERQVRGFEVKPTVGGQPAGPALREKDDHHG